MTTTTPTNYLSIERLIPAPYEQIALAIWGGRIAEETTGTLPRGAFVYTQHVVDAPTFVSKNGAPSTRPVLVQIVDVCAVDADGNADLDRTLDVTGPAGWYPRGAWQVRYTAAYRAGSRTHWTATGHFYVAVGRVGTLPEPSVTITRGKNANAEPPAAEMFPGNVHVEAVSGMRARRQLGDAARVARDGWQRLFNDEANVVWGRSKVRRQADGRFVEHAVFDMGDMVQEFDCQVIKEMQKFTTYRRPDCTWTDLVKMNCLREPLRAFNRTRFEAGLVLEIRAWANSNNIDADTPPAQVRLVKATQKAITKFQKANPGVSYVEAEGLIGDVDPALCSWTDDQIVRALKPQYNVASLDVPAGDGTSTLGDSLAVESEEDGDFPVYADMQSMAEDLGVDPVDLIAIGLKRRQFFAEEFPADVASAAAKVGRDRKRFEAICAQFSDGGMLDNVTRSVHVNETGTKTVTFKSTADIGALLSR